MKYIRTITLTIVEHEGYEYERSEDGIWGIIEGESTHPVIMTGGHLEEQYQLMLSRNVKRDTGPPKENTQ